MRGGAGLVGRPRGQGHVSPIVAGRVSTTTTTVGGAGEVAPATVAGQLGPSVAPATARTGGRPGLSGPTTPAVSTAGGRPGGNVSAVSRATGRTTAVPTHTGPRAARLAGTGVALLGEGAGRVAASPPRIPTSGRGTPGTVSGATGGGTAPRRPVGGRLEA